MYKNFKPLADFNAMTFNLVNPKASITFLVTILLPMILMYVRPGGGCTHHHLIELMTKISGLGTAH